MTREEAIEILERDSCNECAIISDSPLSCHYEGHCDVKEAVKVAIEALKQKSDKVDREPCEDCISRKAMIDYFEKNYPYSELIEMCVQEVVDAVEHAPSVTPSRPHGKWTVYDHGYGLIYLKCSLCGKTYQRGRCNYNFCPNCGADMGGSSNGT